MAIGADKPGPVRNMAILYENLTEKIMKKVIVYTDGSCLGNPGPGGWAAILVLSGTDYRKEISGGFRLTTNNRMELLAAIKGLTALNQPCEVELFTDSQYLGNAISKGWMTNWRKNGWAKKKGAILPNADLWKNLDLLLNIHKIKVNWLRGHAGHIENERCDKLARAAASEPVLAIDENYEAGIAS